MLGADYSQLNLTSFFPFSETRSKGVNAKARCNKLSGEVVEQCVSAKERCDCIFWLSTNHHRLCSNIQYSDRRIKTPRNAQDGSIIEPN